jgi:hypothetical protein
MSECPELRAAIEAVGKEYIENQKCKADTADIQRKYEAVADTVNKLFDQIQVPVIFQEKDPYSDYEDMAKTVAEEQKLRVYSGHAGHPVMSDRENLKFRAVHDWHGHLRYDVNFTTEGEFMKWFNMRDTFPIWTHNVLFAEVVGQLGAIKYLPDSFNDPRYEQKAIELPPRHIHRMIKVVLE